MICTLICLLVTLRAHLAEALRRALPHPRAARLSAHCPMSSASAAPASPKAAASASARGRYSTPSKRGATEVDASSGPALAVKKRRRACADASADASAEAPAAAPPVPARDVTCGVCLEPVAAGCKPVDCSHLLCHTCAHQLWCCPQCRAQMSRACPTCRAEIFYEELEGDKEADKIAINCAKKSLAPAELALWRKRKSDGLQLFKRNEQGSVQALQLAIKEEREFEHAVIVSRSPSSRAICACCSEQISCGTLRVHRIDGRFSHVTCHDIEAEMQEVCTAERIGLGEVHVCVETNIVDPKLLRPDAMEIRRADPAQLHTLRQKLTNAAGMSQWFCELPMRALLGLPIANTSLRESGHIHRNSGNVWGHAAEERLGLVPERPAARSTDDLLSPIGDRRNDVPNPLPNPRFAQLMQAMVFDAFFAA